MFGQGLCWADPLSALSTTFQEVVFPVSISTVVLFLLLCLWCLMLMRELMKTNLYVNYRKLLKFDAENYPFKLKAF